MWPKLIDETNEEGTLNLKKFFRSMDRIIREQQELTAIPRKFHGYIKDIWSLQLKLETRLGHQPYKILNHPRFRAAYDFLLLREQAGEELDGLGQWWTDFQNGDQKKRKELSGAVPRAKNLRRRRNKRKQIGNSE